MIRQVVSVTVVSLVKDEQQVALWQRTMTAMTCYECMNSHFNFMTSCTHKITLLCPVLNTISLLNSYFTKCISVVFVPQILTKVRHIIYRLSLSHYFEKRAFKVCIIGSLLACHHVFTSFEIVFIVWIWLNSILKAKTLFI